MRGSVDMNFLFTLGELQRLVRAYADKQAARHGITRAQWAVLAKVERTEGLKQTELAEQMEPSELAVARQIRQCDARFDVLHFEETSEPPDEDDEADDILDPTALLLVLGTLGELTGGLAVDPQSGTLLCDED